MTISDIGDAWDANKRVIMPLGFLAVLAGAVWWASSFYNTVQQMANDIREIKANQAEYVTKTMMETRFELHLLRYHRDQLIEGQ